MDSPDKLPSPIAQSNFESGPVAAIVLSYFDNAAGVADWSALSRTCRRWCDIVSKFVPAAEAGPHRLYYDKYSIARHDIAPPFEVYSLLPQNILSAGIDLRGDGTGRQIPLGWPGGVTAVKSIIAKWPPPKSICRPLYCIWAYNCAFECARLLLIYELRSRTRGVQRRSDEIDVIPMNCIDNKGFNYANYRRNDTASSAVYDMMMLVRRIRDSNRAPPNLSQKTLFSLHLHFSALPDSEFVLRDILDGMELHLFNIAVATAACFYPQQIKIIKESNNRRPRYDGFFDTADPRLIARAEMHDVADEFRSLRRAPPTARPPMSTEPVHDVFACSYCMYE